MKKLNLMIAILLFLSSSGLCQIEGDIRDTANNRIAKAKILAVDSTNNVVDSVITDETGFYEFTNLKPGKYLIEAKAVGFETRQYKNVIARARINDPEVGKDISNATRLQIVLLPAKPKQ